MWPLLALTGVPVAMAGLMAYAVRGRSSAFFGASVHRGAGNRRAVALTFDDGPSESTGEILEILDAYKAPATFFQCGANVRRLPDVARRVASAGHEIGNHGDTHAPLYLRRAGFIGLELERAQRSITEVTGRVPSLFRAPYGARWFGLDAAQRRLGLLGVMWTAIGLDWKLPAGLVAARLERAASNGAIFCLHDGRQTRPRPDVRASRDALRLLLPRLVQRGFHFEKVSDILCRTT